MPYGMGYGTMRRAPVSPEMLNLNAAAPRPAAPLTIPGMSTDAVYEAQRQGLFDPMGSPAIMARLRRQGMRSMRNQMRRGSVTGRLLGLDPWSQRAAMMDIGRESAGGLADFLNQAQLGQMQSGQDWARGLMAQEREFAEQRRREREARKGGLGALLGTALGAGAGALVGNPMLGAKLGGAVGGAVSKRRQPIPEQYDFENWG